MTWTHQLGVGDGIGARRKIKSKLYHNLVVGRVISVYDNAVLVRCNAGSDMERDFQLFFDGWDFQILIDGN